MLKKAFYFFGLPVSILVVCNYIIPNSGLFNFVYALPPLLNIALLGFLAFPTLLTSLIASIVATVRKKSLRLFLLYWLLPSIIAFIPDVIYRTYPTFGGISFFSPLMAVGMIAAGVIGITLGKIIILAKKGTIKVPKRPHGAPHTLVSFFLLWVMMSLFFTFLTGVFANTVDLEKYTNPYSYYIHRGIPIPFSGVTRYGSTPSYPVITLPWFTEKLNNDTFIKSINLVKFLQAFAFYFALSLLPAFSLASTVKTKLQATLIVLVAFGILLGIFVLWGHVII
jgi:hypothetical protein